tara:strand:+ start:117 stop:473 length:357 start_codon:yes stop_codon:yes gene_type:complete
MREIVCPHCQAQLNGPDEGGVEVTCSNCVLKFLTPEAQGLPQIKVAHDDPLESRVREIKQLPPGRPPLGAKPDLIKVLKEQTEILEEILKTIKGVTIISAFSLGVWIFFRFLLPLLLD